MDGSLKILIVDENVACRRFLANALVGLDGVEVVDSAANGRIALAKLRQSTIDVVLFDVKGAIGDLIETLKRIASGYPDISVVLLGEEDAAAPDLIVKSLLIGALEYIRKPSPVGPDKQQAQEFRRLLSPLLGLLRTRRNLRAVQSGKPLPLGSSAAVALPRRENGITRPSSEPVQPQFSSLTPRRFDVVVIGISTGGPNALAEVIPRLPAEVGVPILLVQHMPAGMTTSLAGSLNTKSRLSVREATHGEEVLTNTVYLAPGGRHMLVIRESDNLGPGRRMIALSDSPPENSCRPAADVLFRSVAAAYDGNILAVIMTGMGNDGLAGLRIMKEKGCYCLTQTEETCTVYGMPRVVNNARLADEQVPLDRLATRIAELAGRGRPK